MLDAIGARKRFSGRRGEVTATPTKAYRKLRGGRNAHLDARVGRAEQSNTSVVLGDRMILKLFRRLEPGMNPELEIGVALTERGFEQAADVGGWLAYRSARDEPAAIGILQEYVPNQGDVWQLMLDSVGAFFEEVAAHEAPADGNGAATVAAVLDATKQDLPQLAADTIGEFLDVARLLGTRTAQLHASLSSATDDPAFAKEPFSALHQRSIFQTLRNQAASTFGLLKKRGDDLPVEASIQAAEALEMAPAVQARLVELTKAKVGCERIRIHADFHAGQVLWTGKDVVFIDFEGEPGRPISERRHKKSALTDVAGMLRSFHYAAFGTLLNPRVGGAIRPEDVTATGTVGGLLVPLGRERVPAGLLDGIGWPGLHPRQARGGRNPPEHRDAAEGAVRARLRAEQPPRLGVDPPPRLAGPRRTAELAQP